MQRAALPLIAQIDCSNQLPSSKSSAIFKPVNGEATGGPRAHHWWRFPTAAPHTAYTALHGTLARLQSLLAHTMRIALMTRLLVVFFLSNYNANGSMTSIRCCMRRPCCSIGFDAADAQRWALLPAALQIRSPKGSRSRSGSQNIFCILIDEIRSKFSTICLFANFRTILNEYTQEVYNSSRSFDTFTSLLKEKVYKTVSFFETSIDSVVQFVSIWDTIRSTVYLRPAFLPGHIDHSDGGLYLWSPSSVAFSLVVVRIAEERKKSVRADNGTFGTTCVRPYAERADRRTHRNGENLGEALKHKAATEHQVQGCRLACRYFSMLETRRSWFGKKTRCTLAYLSALLSACWRKRTTLLTIHWMLWIHSMDPIALVETGRKNVRLPCSERASQTIPGPCKSFAAH